MSALHRFVRNPNYLSSITNRVGNRANPFQNTLVELKDPKNDRTLYLIGTTNSNSMLAYRTQKLINDIKPDVVFVQASEKFGKIAKQIDVQSQQEMNEYNNYIMQCSSLKFDDNIRSIGFAMRFYSWLYLANLIKYFPKDFHPFIPGLEMKFAIEAAEKNGAEVKYGGMELGFQFLIKDQNTFDALKLQNNLNPFSLLWRLRSGFKGDFWDSEKESIYKTLSVQGGEAFAESVDKSRVNWFVKYFQKIMPYQKKIFIDEDLFYQIYKKNTGKVTIAVVNQWHMEGIASHWKLSTKTEDPLLPINPVGDFDIEKLMESELIQDKLREITSKICSSEPATHQGVITHYHKEVQEYERTRHVHFEDAKDPHMYHGLPENSNDAPLKPLSEINQKVPIKLDQIQ